MPFQKLKLINGKKRILNSESRHNDLIQVLAYDKNQNIAASADIWGNMKIWNLEERKTLMEIQRFSNDIYHSEISPGGDFISYNNN